MPSGSKTEEVSPWLSRRERFPRQDATRDAALTGSCPFPAWSLARTAASPVCPTEPARLAVITMAARLSKFLRSNPEIEKLRGRASAPFLFSFSDYSQFVFKFRLKTGDFYGIMKTYRFPDPVVFPRQETASRFPKEGSHDETLCCHRGSAQRGQVHALQ